VIPQRAWQSHLKNLVRMLGNIIVDLIIGSKKPINQLDFTQCGSHWTTEDDDEQLKVLQLPNQTLVNKGERGTVQWSGTRTSIGTTFHRPWSSDHVEFHLCRLKPMKVGNAWVIHKPVKVVSCFHVLESQCRSTLGSEFTNLSEQNERIRHFSTGASMVTTFHQHWNVDQPEFDARVEIRLQYYSFRLKSLQYDSDILTWLKLFKNHYSLTNDKKIHFLQINPHDNHRDTVSHCGKFQFEASEITRSI
jgi:hypothetical protein